MDIEKWLRGLGLQQYVATFHSNAIDAEVLAELTEADLEKLGVVLGHRKRLLKAIATLASPAALEQATPVGQAPSIGDGAERRQQECAEAFVRRQDLQSRLLELVLGAIDPALVELERFRIGRADHRAVAIDRADVLDGGALIDLQPDRLEPGRVATHRSAFGNFVQRRRADVDRDLGPPQRDVGQFLKLLRTLLVDDRGRREMPPAYEYDQADRRQSSLG